MVNQEDTIREFIYELSINPIPGWFFTPEREFVIRKIINLPKPSRCADVGTYCGLSAACQAFGCKLRNDGLKVLAIEPFKGNLTENCGDGAITADTFWGHIKRFVLQEYVELYEGYSFDAVKMIDDESLGFVLIDTDHFYDETARNIREWYPKIYDGGVLALHDYGLAWSADDQVAKAVSDTIDGLPNVLPTPCSLAWFEKTKALKLK